MTAGSQQDTRQLQQNQADEPSARGWQSSEANRQAREARQRMVVSGYAPLTRLRCQSDGETLKLEGRVPSYYLKQLAQTVVRGIVGVTAIVNNVHVE